MADEFNNQTQNNDAQVQNAVNAALDQQKKQKKKKKLIILGVIVAVIVVIAVAAGSGSSDKETTNPVETIADSGETAADSGDAEATTTAGTQKIEAGNAITVENELKISYTECNVDFKDYESYDAPADGKKYVSATFKIENISDSDAFINDVECYADGTKCSEKWVSGVELDSPFFKSLSVGRNVEGTIFFEVPADASEIELEYTPDDVWASEEKVIFVIK